MKLKIILGSIGSISVAILFYYLYRSREISLLEFSHPITSVNEADIEDGSYYWMTNHDLLLDHGLLAKGVRFERLNITTKIITPLPRLSQQFTETGLDSTPIKISSDGEFVIWENIDGGVAGAKINEKVQFEVECDGWIISNFAWVNGTHKWILFESDDEQMSRAILYDADTNRKIQTLIVNSDHNITLRSQVVVSGNYQLFVNNLSDFSSEKAEITEAKIDTTSHLTQRHGLIVPTHSDYLDATVSPDGSRVAYSAWYLKEMPIKVLMERILPPNKNSYEAIETSFVSDSTGKTRNIGYLPYFDTADQKMIDFKWSPDTKSMSYIYRGELYITQID